MSTRPGEQPDVSPCSYALFKGHFHSEWLFWERKHSQPVRDAFILRGVVISPSLDLNADSDSPKSSVQNRISLMLENLFPESGSGTITSPLILGKTGHFIQPGSDIKSKEGNAEWRDSRIRKKEPYVYFCRIIKF